MYSKSQIYYCKDIHLMSKRVVDWFHSNTIHSLPISSHSTPLQSDNISNPPYPFEYRIQKMIQNKFLSESFNLNTRRSSPYKNTFPTDHTYINNSSIIYLTFRKSDRHTITGLQTISPIGEINLIVSTSQLLKLAQEDDSIDELMLFEIKKVQPLKYQPLKYRESFYLLHKYSGQYLVCKQNCSEMSLLEFSADYQERGVFYCQNVQEQGMCQLYVQPSHNVRICNVYAKSKYLKVLSEHNIHKNTLAFCSESSLFNLSIYRADDSIPTLTKTSYVEIHLKETNRKLRVVPSRWILESDFTQPFHKYCKPDSFELVEDERVGTIWKIQVKNRRLNTNNADIRYGEQISFKCTNTGLYLSYDSSNPNQLFIVHEQSKKACILFRIDKLINKISEATGNEDSAIWFDCPVEMNGARFILKKASKTIKESLIFNRQFQPALQSLQYLKRLYSISANKYSPEINQHTVRDQVFVLIRHINIFQQLYDRFLNQIAHQNEKQITFIRSMVWLCSISKKQSLFNDRRIEEEMLGQTLQNQYQILVGRILKYIHAALQYISPQLFEKEIFYSIITLFLPTHRYIVELIYVEALKYSREGYGFRYLSKKIHFMDSTSVEMVRILRKLYENQTIKNQKFLSSQNLDVEIKPGGQNKIVVNIKCRQEDIFDGQIDHKTSGVVFHYILFATDIKRVSVDQIEELINPLHHLYLMESSTNQLKIFILSLINIYFSHKIPIQSTAVCLKYGSINHDSKAYQMFISSTVQGSIYKSSLCMDPIIDATISIFNKRTLRYKMRNLMEYIELMKQYLNLLEYYTILGIYTISRLMSIVQSTLECCGIINSYNNQQFSTMVMDLKKQKQFYIKHQSKEVEDILIRILKRQTQLLDSWLLHPSQISTLESELTNIKIESFKLLGIVSNQELYNSIKHLSTVRTDSHTKYTFIKEKYFRNKEYSKISTVKEIVNHLFELFKKLESTHDQSAIKTKIEEKLKSIDIIVVDLNHQFKGEKFQLFHMQSIIRENGVYQQLAELLLTQAKSIIHFDWKSITLFLCNFIIGNPTNAKLLLPCRFQELLLGDELDILITQIFIYAESPRQILRLQKRLHLTNDIRHRIKYFRILLTLSNKVDEEKIESTLTNKMVILQMLLRIQGFDGLVKQLPDSYRLGTKHPRTYDSFNEYSLEIHKVLVYLLCEVSKNTPLNCFQINKWFPVQQIVEICIKPSQLYWEIIKPYLYILDCTLTQLNIGTINQVSLAILRNFSSQLNRTVKSMIVYDDMFTKINVWSILEYGEANFELHFPLKDSANSLTLFPRRDQHYWRLFYCMEEDCIKFGLLNYIITLLEYHQKVTPLSPQLIAQISQLNVLFEGFLWVLGEIQRIKEEQQLEVTFISVKKHLKYTISMLQQISPDLPRFVREEVIALMEEYLNQDQFLEEYSATSLKPLVREERKNKSNPMSQPTRQEIRKILKHQTEVNLAESPVELIQASPDLSKISMITVPSQYNWNNLLLYSNFSTLSDLHFLQQFIATFTFYFQSNYSKNIELFLFKLSEKLKSADTIPVTDNFTEYLTSKLKILKQILEIIYRYKNIEYLQKDFESFSLMLRNTFDFVEKPNSEWRILVEITSICTIYLSCLKDPTSEMRLLEQIFNNTNSQIQRLQLMTKLFSTSMELEGSSSIQFLSDPKLCQSHSIPVIQLCLKQDLNINNQQLQIVYEMLEVVLHFNLFVTQKFQTNIFDSQYFNLLCSLKNKIVKQRLMENIHHLTSFTSFSSQFTQSMTEQEFSVYLLLILITIENVCEMVIPPNEKYLFNSSTDSFHLFYTQHLSEVEIVYKGKNIIVCYPKFFNQRNIEIKNSAVDLVKEEERGSFNILMKAAEIVESEEIQLECNPRIIEFLKRHKECINCANILSILIATLYLLIYKSSNLSREEFDPVSFILLFASFLINILNFVSSCIDYYHQTTFQHKISFKSSKNYERIEGLLYYSCLIIFSICCFVEKYLISFLLLIMICQRFGIRMFDSIFSAHTKKLVLLILVIASIYIMFLEFSSYSYRAQKVHFTKQTLGDFFSLGILPATGSPWNVVRDLLFYTMTSICIPAVFLSFLIMFKIVEMNTSNIFKCLVCQKVFNHNSFSKHGVHKLSNYMSYYSFILERKSPLNKLEEYVKTHITNSDIGIFPE